MRATCCRLGPGVLALTFFILASCGDSVVVRPTSASSSSVLPEGTSAVESVATTMSSELQQAPVATAQPDANVSIDMSAIESDKGLWRVFSMRADWIFATRSFTDLLKYADVVVLATVVEATDVEAVAIEGVGGALTYIDLHLEVISGLTPAGIEDLVLRIEAPGSLTPESRTAYENWFSAGKLPVNPALFVLRKKGDADRNVYQIVNEWSIWITDGDEAVSTAFEEEDRRADSTTYLQVVSSVATLKDLLTVLRDPQALGQLER